MAIVEHRSIDNAGCIFREMLQVLVVRGDYSKATVTIETIEQCLGDCPTNLRLGATAKLIDQQQGTLVAMLDEILHVC